MGTRLSKSTNPSIVACGPRLPRMRHTLPSLHGGILHFTELPQPAGHVYFTSCCDRRKDAIPLWQANRKAWPLRVGRNDIDLVWLVLLSLSLFIVLLPISSYVAALSLIKSELGLNNAGAGALFSAYLAGYAVSALYLVPLTDRLGPKRIIYVSAVLSVAAHLLFPLATHNVLTGVALRAIAGVGFLGIYIPGLRLVARRFEQGRRGSAMGLFVTAQYAAHSGSLALTGWLMATMEWRDAYALVAAASALSLPLMFFLVRSVPDTRRPLTGGRLDLTVLKNGPVQFVILGYTVHALNLYALRVWLPIFLASILIARGVAEGKAVVTAAEVGGLALAFGALGPVMGGIISDRLGRTTAASVILALSALCAIGHFAWIGHWPWGLIVAASVVFGWAASADSAIYQTGMSNGGGRSEPPRLYDGAPGLGGPSRRRDRPCPLRRHPRRVGGRVPLGVRLLHPRRPRRDCDSRPSQSRVPGRLKRTPSARKGRSVGISQLPAPPPKEAQSDAY